VKVPFNDLARQYATLKDEMDRAVWSALHQFNFVRSAVVADFENQFAETLGISHCVSTGNGTDALFLILKAMGIQAGDEVITPAFSWISSAETISWCGARPVFADVHTDHFLIDLVDIENRITAKTKALIVVHLYGQAAPMKEIAALCKKHKLFLIEDCAQAHLTKDGDAYAGTFGDAAAFSFYPTKNLGAYGDAGCVITHNTSLAEKIRRLANHGALQKDDHLIEGMNSRMDSLQASVLATKLPHLEKWNSLRRKNAALYHEQLKGITQITLPDIRPETEHTFHLYVIRAIHRQALQQFLDAQGVQTLVHYPCALPNLPAYRHLNYTPDEFPVATRLQNEVLSLPIHPDLSSEQIDYVCENIREFFLK
jgi:dTDP-4-amino-4,6-dideoxygalactose transaminase